MPRKFKDIIKLIEKDGWVLVAQVGSHRQYKHPTKPGRVTIAAHKISDDISLKTGFLGSGSPRNVCQKCGYKWKPVG